MIHRVVITGAESTGKTTLAQALADYYAEPWTNEFVRDYVEQLDRELQPDDLEPIARGQLAGEDAKLEQAQQLIIHDTNILSSIIYAKHYFKTKLDWVDKGFRERSYSLYLLCMPDIPWEAETSQRESPEVRNQLHQTFKANLSSLKLPHIEIHGAKEARLRQAVAIINKLLSNVER
jgi:NadR type nicotinamide-nucleotide adenylyltransferase